MFYKENNAGWNGWGYSNEGILKVKIKIFSNTCLYQTPPPYTHTKKEEQIIL
jgi:hypothetical protein